MRARVVALPRERHLLVVSLRPSAQRRHGLAEGHAKRSKSVVHARGNRVTIPSRSSPRRVSVSIRSEIPGRARRADRFLQPETQALIDALKAVAYRPTE